MATGPAVKKTVPGRRKPLLPLVSILVLFSLAAGAYLYLHRHHRPTPPAEATYALRAVTVNLLGYGEHFLRVEPVLVLPAPLKKRIEAERYKIIDRVITVLRSDRYAEVMAPGGQKLAQVQVARAAAQVVPGVQKAYFTQFLVD